MDFKLNKIEFTVKVQVLAKKKKKTENQNINLLNCKFSSGLNQNFMGKNKREGYYLAYSMF